MHHLRQRYYLYRRWLHNSSVFYESQHMKPAFIATLLVLAQFVCNSACWASDFTGSGINGVIWIDENENGVFEPTEPTVDNAVVNVRGDGEDFIQSVLVDEDGYFKIDGLAYGLYFVWAEMNGLTSETVLIEINEVSPVTVIDIALTPTVQPQLPYQIWMPVAVR